jgi:cell division protein FtsA
VTKKIAAIDIGTTKVCTIMGLQDDKSGVRITGVGVGPSHGIEMSAKSRNLYVSQ